MIELVDVLRVDVHRTNLQQNFQSIIWSDEPPPKHSYAVGYHLQGFFLRVVVLVLTPMNYGIHISISD